MRCGSSDVTVALLVAVNLFSAAAASALGVLAQPANFYLAVHSGAFVEEQIRISPTSDGTTARLSLSPFTIDEHGQPATCHCRADRTMVQWAELSAAQVILQPGRYESITLRVTVPQSAEGSYWGAVLIDVEGTPNGTSDQAPIRSRLAIPVLLTVIGTELPRAKITELKAFTTRAGDVVVTGVVTNDGNMVLHAPLVLALEDASTSVPTELASIDDALITVLPDTRRVFRLTIARDVVARPELRVTAWLRFGSGVAAVAEESCGVSAQPPCDPDRCLAT